MTDTVKVWQSDIGLRVERYTEGRNVRGLVWRLDPMVWKETDPATGLPAQTFRAFRGEFKVTPEGHQPLVCRLAPGESGWLCIGFRDERFTSLKGALLWLTDGFDE